MSLKAIVKGLVTLVKGVTTGDVVKVAKGAGGVVVGTTGTVVTHTVSQTVGEMISGGGEAINEDEQIIG